MLQVRRLEKLIEGRSVLSIDEFDVAAGEVVAVVGPARSGKTLLVRVLAGVLMPSGGTVMLDGQDIYHVPALRERIGVLLQDDLHYERLSVRENLELYRQMRGTAKERVGEVLRLIGLSDQAKVPASRLSASAQRRLAFARLLLAPASIYLLDQPVLRCDFDTQQLFTRLIVQLAADGAAVLLTTEDLFWVNACYSRVVELHDGRIVNRYSRPGPGSDEHEGSTAPEHLTPYRVPARKEDRIILFDPGDILYATSRDGRTYLRTVNEEATTNLTLQELESRLVGRGFFKAHRAYLVNLQHIRAVVQYTRNSYSLLLNDKQETMIPLSKNSEKELQALLGY